MPSSLTAFDRALETYLDTLPRHKQKCKFFELCRGSGDVSPQAINTLIQQEQSKHALHGPARRVFNRLTSALNDYSEVMGQLASVQPLPLAIIWGGLKCVIEGATRCNDMFDLMKDELRALTDQIQRITDYEDLYQNSDPMQDLFFRSYTNILRFWHRVHKECKRGGFDTFRHSLTSSNTKKLGAIVNDLKYDVDCIAKKATIIQAQLDSHEYAQAQTERNKAEDERVHQSTWRAKQNAHNYLELCTRIRDFLTPTQAASANLNRHESNLQHHQDDTCLWLTEEPCFIAWSDLKTSNPVFCLSGPAGYGKSILTSYVIRRLQQDAAVAYYFCQFSQPCDSTSELLRLLALQLFNIYFLRRLPVDEALCHKVLCSNSNQELQELLLDLSSSLAPAYFAVDGLDEVLVGNSQNTLSHVLRFICTELVPKTGARLWLTKRRQARPVECFEAVTEVCSPFMLEVADHTEADVVRYLRAKFVMLERRFGTLSDEDTIFFHLAEKDLTSRAKGHFLWARLMTQSFEGEGRVEDVQDLLDRVSGPPPEALDDLYQQIFLRIKPENRKIASKLVALIAFSRRQLRVEEVREAAVLLITRGKKNGNDGGLSKMPLHTLLSKFTVLVEIDRGLLSEDDGLCRLVHSSVLEFLINKPTVLGDDRALHITPYLIADACLLYLSRPVLAQPLKRALTSAADTTDWTDGTGRSMDAHPFVQYAAKNWSRHLQDLDAPPDGTLRRRVAAFVESTNFQTCMQIQAIWVQGQFDVYGVNGEASLLRVLPEWLIHAPPSSAAAPTPAPVPARAAGATGRRRSAVAKHWSDYRLLLHDWRYLLSCGGCHDCEPACLLLAYRGELDRIWWGSLGRGHLFSGFQGRYTSFCLADPEQGLGEGGDRFEAIAVSSQHILVLRLSLWNREARTLEFVCERWSLEGSNDAPTLAWKQVISTDEVSTNWALYSGRQLPTTDASKVLVARPVMVSNTGDYLRVGAQMFRYDAEQDQYHALVLSQQHEDGGDEDGAPAYFEEVDARGPFVAFATRAYTAAQRLQSPYLREEGFGKNYARMVRRVTRTDDDEESDEDSEDDGWSSDEDSDSESDSGDSALEGYESWSEGSTDDEAALDSDDMDDDDDILDVVGGMSDSASETEVDSDSEAGSTSGGSGSTNVDSEESDDEIPPHGFLDDPEGIENSDDEEDAWGHAIDSRLGTDQDGRPAFANALADAPIMQLVVFDTSGDRPRRVFVYTHPMSFMLYASPPVFHPLKPLVVWPLGGGDVLFADFVRKTYFTRKLRPSAPYTRNISVKIRFHSTGHFLHIACLEAQIVETRKRRKRKHKSDHSQEAKLKLFVLLSTYRLSSRKTTRSPPSLVHRVKYDLGGRASLAISHLPFTFTWTDDDLFVTQSATELSVIRIPLFVRLVAAVEHGPTQHRKENVLVPRNKTFLPRTARTRAVHFVPCSGDAGGSACVVIGSERKALPAALVGGGGGDDDDDCLPLRKPPSAPVGCLLDGGDIGGWVRVEDAPVPRGQGVGKLDRRKERFDPVDDCDVEPYLLFA